MATVADDLVDYVIDTKFGSFDMSSTQNAVNQACAMLNKQRVRLLNGESTHSTQEALEAVEARKRALCVFTGMPDAETMENPLLRQLLVPLDFPVADEEEFTAYWEKENEEQETPLPMRNNMISSTLSRKSRFADFKTTWVSDYAKVEFLSMSPTIIKLQDGDFIELRCDICGGNSGYVHNTFIKGVRGFHSHFRQVHSVKPDPNAVLQRCKHRDVPAEEVGRIISGKSQIETIPCASSTRLDSNNPLVGRPIGNTQNQTKRAGNTVESLAAKAAADTTTNGATNLTSVSMPPPVIPKKKRPTSSSTASNTATSIATSSSKPSTPRKRDVSVPSLNNCSIVIQNTLPDGDNKFYELRCDVCHGNGSFGSGKLLDGTKGFKAHLRQIHKEDDPTTTEIVRRCSYREVPLQEVQQIQSGIVNIGFRVCEHSPNVRPKKSYKDFNSAERT